MRETRDDSSFENMVLHRLDEIHQDVKDVRLDVKDMGKQVSELQLWKSRMQGALMAWSIVASLVASIAVSVVANLVKRA